MKKCFFLLLFAAGLLALIPTQSQAQVVISVQPAYRNGYYYQAHPQYYRHHVHAHRYYYHNGRYYYSQGYHQGYYHND